MKPHDTIEAQCLARGLKLTGQRVVIARVLDAAVDHPDADEIYRRARQADPSLALSTVYRALNLWAEHGVIDRHDFGDGRGRFEPAGRARHDHLIDADNGRVVEFADEALEALQAAVAEKLGFRLVGHRLTLYGRPRKS